jgi:hypothetical protein
MGVHRRLKMQCPTCRAFSHLTITVYGDVGDCPICLQWAPMSITLCGHLLCRACAGELIRPREFRRELWLPERLRISRLLGRPIMSADTGSGHIGYVTHEEAVVIGADVVGFYNDGPVSRFYHGPIAEAPARLLCVEVSSRADDAAAEEWRMRCGSSWPSVHGAVHPELAELHASYWRWVHDQHAREVLMPEA